MGLFDFFKKKNRTVSETKVTISFGMPKAANDFGCLWDKRRSNANTDYADVNFLCHFKKIHLLSDDPNQFARAVSYKLHIYDPVKKRDELLKQGFLRLTAPAETLTTYKVTELKDILNANSLPTTGKKLDLISRIVLSVDLEKLNLPKMCCISEKGTDFINQNQDLCTLYSNPYGVTYEEYIAAKKEAHAYSNYNDIIWFVFNQRELLASNNYNQRCWNAHCRAVFLEAEKKHIGALEHFIYELYFELNDPSRVVPDSIRQHYTDDELKPHQLQPHIVESIFKLKEHFSAEMIDRCYKRIDVPKRLIKRSDFERLLNDIFTGKEIDVGNYLPKGLR